MSNLQLEHLAIRTSTSDGLYGVDIPFKSGLNIIHAENTHGKSTCIQSIIFALGLEGCLGPSRKVPLKAALTSQLRTTGKSKATIFESIIYLKICNKNKDSIVLSRSSNPDKLKLVSVFKNASISQAINKSTASTDFYLHDEGSATRERGFHCFLSEFLDITQPKVMKYNGSESPLYLESIFSMNYVEQTRGWGGILNVLPTYLGIKELSERIIEYTLDLEVQIYAKKKQELNQNKKDSERIWTSLFDRLTSVAKNASGFVSNELDEKITKKTTLSANTYLYHYTNNDQSSFFQQIQNLKSELSILKEKHSGNVYDEQKHIKLHKELANYTEILSTQEQAIDLLISDLNVSEKYAQSIERRIYDISDSLRKYKDLERLESIGSEEQFQLSRHTCPTCHTEIQDSLISYAQSEKVNVLGLQDNIKYLEKQKESFISLLEGETQNRINKEVRLSVANSNLDESRKIIREIKNSLIDEKSVPSRSDIKRELIIESNIEKLEKALNQEDQIIGKLQETLNDWQRSDSALAALPSSGFSGNDWKKLKALKKSFISNLEDFGYSSNELSDFEISIRSYKPTLNDVDINSEASASDNIRIIWSYLYSFLTLDYEAKVRTNHLGILIMDEPRQQEAKKESFAEFINKAAEVKKMDKQIIIGTSENYNELCTAIKELDVSVQHFDADIIKKM